MADWDNLNKLELENDEPKIDESSLQEEAIAFSVKIIEALSQKMTEHNKENPNKVSLKELKDVYIRGGSEVCLNHQDCGHRALARVNMFLRLKQGEHIALDTEFETESEAMDISEGWIPSEEDYNKASKEIEELNLNYSFSSISKLYIENYERIDWEW